MLHFRESILTFSRSVAWFRANLVGFINSIPLQIRGLRRNENHHGLEPERSDRGGRGHPRAAAVADGGLVTHRA
jgi:hypothetical protein